MNEKIKETVIKLCGYIVAGAWIMTLIVIPVLIIAGSIKLINIMFGG